ncbi:MAG: hypothetical protein ACFE9N_08180 [Promethearchaeota archaeon]
MGAGKIFCIIGGIVTLLACFLFSFGDFPPLPGVYFYGLGLFMNIGDIFALGNALAIVFVILGIILMISGLLIILGVKSRVIAIIGSIFAIFMSVWFLLSFYLVFTGDLLLGVTVFAYIPLVDGFIPLHVGLGGTIFATVGLGTYLLLGGGVLGLIGGIMGPDGF